MENPKKAAALIYGPEAHHLDHLAPLCILLDIPLVLTEKELLPSVQAYYPQLKIILKDYLTVAEEVVQHFDVVFYCSVRDLFDEVFFFAQKLYNKRIHTIWCPHGNSDKGHATFFMEALKKEEVALVYGQKMVDFLKLKGSFDQLKAHVVIDNFRYSYYKKNKAFYDRLVEELIIKKLDPDKKTLFYAPTWQDYEKSSSLFDIAPILVEKLPEHYNLIIKLHPNLLHNEQYRVDSLLFTCEEHPRVLFLTDFAPIYPLLEFVDLYIGDMSSIGYDFLAFNKPMFFLNQNSRDPQTDQGLYLFRCGVEVKREQYEDIYKILEAFLPSDAQHFSSIRKEVYDYTFGKERAEEDLKKEIEKTYDCFPDKDLNFF